MKLRDYFQENYFKPLSHFFETKQKTHARTRRSTFGQKFMDTWQMWSGTPSIQRRHLARPLAAKAGLLDYSMLLLPAVIGLIKAVLFDLFLKTIERPRWLVPFLIFLGPILLATGVIDFIFDVIKQTLGLFITLASTLFIAIVHGITILATQQEKKALDQAIDELFKSDQDNPEIQFENNNENEINKPVIAQTTKLPGSKVITNVQLIKKEDDNEHVYLQLNKTCESKANKLVQMSESELTNKNKYIESYPTYILTETALYYKRKRSKLTKSIIITNDKEKIQSLNHLFSCYLVIMSDTAFQQEIKQPKIQLVKMSSKKLNQISRKPGTPRYILTDEELCYQGIDNREPQQLLHIGTHLKNLETLQEDFKYHNNNVYLFTTQLDKIKSLAPRKLDTIMDSPQYVLTDKAFYYKKEGNAEFTIITQETQLIQIMSKCFKPINLDIQCPSNTELELITHYTQHQHIKVFEKLSKKQSDLIHLQTELVNASSQIEYPINEFKNSPYYFFNYGHHDKNKTQGAAEQFEDLFPDL